MVPANSSFELDDSAPWNAKWFSGRDRSQNSSHHLCINPILGEFPDKEGGWWHY